MTRNLTIEAEDLPWSPKSKPFGRASCSSNLFCEWNIIALTARLWWVLVVVAVVLVVMVLVVVMWGCFRKLRKEQMYRYIDERQNKLSEISPSAFVWVVTAYVAQCEPGNQELMPKIKTEQHCHQNHPIRGRCKMKWNETCFNSGGPAPPFFGTFP